ncbi:GntR family transcriptional regulator [Variovorax sp. PCZ-1]|uniref:GntR family transcriptional regulator n=1 Tax=Variovorax sp. PCZ-1 TaxID=2835533 RepID=UPI001BCAFC75|nr:GntR family transcriptional regulator [Variovorax sp. PCZ-1]MBS7808932.1 GntR family transcriptional regulator [Variovorax sp. PCZ-1]
MEVSTTQHIVQALTKAIVAHRLAPGVKLVEQKLADHFGVSRTLVRQALYQLENQRLIVLEPARGAFVASPSIEEAAQVFEVRRMLEAQMTRHFAEQATPAQIKTLLEHVAQEKAAVESGDAPGRIELLGDFHVRMAELLGNTVLAELLSDLISRCALITLMYQSTHAAQESNDEHAFIVEALAKGDAEKAVALMDQHLSQVFNNLQLQKHQPSRESYESLASFAGL